MTLEDFIAKAEKEPEATAPGALLTLEDFIFATPSPTPEPEPTAPGALLTLEDFIAADDQDEPEPVATEPGELLTFEDFIFSTPDFPEPEPESVSAPVETDLSGFSAGDLFALEDSGQLSTEEILAELVSRN